MAGPRPALRVSIIETEIEGKILVMYFSCFFEGGGGGGGGGVDS